MRFSNTPVIIGVGDIKNRSTAIADAKEPATLMLEAIQKAISDTASFSNTDLQSAIDSVDVVKTWTWPYPDLPGLLAEKLGIEKNLKWKRYSEHGGDKPGKLFDEAAQRIAKGECKVAVVTGGEALASLSACAAARKIPPPGWTAPSEAVDSVFTPTGRDLGNSLGAIHKIGAPIHVYPLYENAFRAHRGQTPKANHEESAKLYAAFSEVAKKNEYAWNYGSSISEREIGTVGKRNRMICHPYPLLMNAFNTVNLASAIILTSTSFAGELGVPESKWIYPLGGAGTKDADEFWKRPNFYSSPSISRSIDASLEVSGARKDEMDIIDIYSCFPIVPKIAAQHLGLPVVDGDKPLTILGGLTSFGGAGNNYSMHALTEMTRRLRDAPGLALDPKGEAVIETYTVEFNRDGSPLRGHVIGRLKSSNRRFLANHGDDITMRRMASVSGELVGKSGSDLLTQELLLPHNRHVFEGPKAIYQERLLTVLQKWLKAKSVQSKGPLLGFRRVYDSASRGFVFEGDGQ
ncbi:hypothetical protein G6011_02194 [Alternaria panax]|uniref:Thiolase-like protein type 1 additional C-terminal domain-containing protein n=1 Tax=Alternaria panax TaxID=48097 RepID=A0AAD4FEP5_9PLEO|nr:hypothetical protein G6011_02194 [Alternaria panax]